jgi:hypothetical protein
VTARILHDLIDYELRVSPDVEALDVGLDGDSEAAEEDLILCHVVRGRKVQTHGVPQMFPEGRMKSRPALAKVFITDPSK